MLRRLILSGCLLACPTLLRADDSNDETEPLRPERTIELFNGRDLSGLTTWMKDSGRDDPRGVFSVRDGVLCVSGEGHGYIATRQAYRDYHLSLEYKWGRRIEPNNKYVRNSGVLLHATGPDGSRGGVWMNSIEVQLAQGCEGDLIVIRGGDEASQAHPATISSETVVDSDKKTRWKRGGEKTPYQGKQFWWSRHDPEFKELLDTRGRWDVASPRDEWTRVECLCEGDRITIKINGHEVNECFDAVPSAGKILLQNEGYEVQFRNWRVGPLPGRK